MNVLVSALSVAAAVYYIATSFLVLGFMRNLRFSQCNYRNLIVLSSLQVFAAAGVALAYAVEANLLFTLWWGALLCLSINSLRILPRRFKELRELKQAHGQAIARIKAQIVKACRYENHLDQ